MERVTNLFCWLIFPALTVWPRVRTEDLVVTVDEMLVALTKGRRQLLVPYCLGLFLPSQLCTNLNATCGRFVFLLHMNFYSGTI